MKEIVIMRFILSVLILLASMLATFGAVNYPARTNGNNTFYGTNSHIGPVIVGVTNQIDNEGSVINDIRLTNGVITFSGSAQTRTTSAPLTYGYKAGEYAASSTAVMIGRESGRYATNAQTSTLVGPLSGKYAVNALGDVFLGYSAGERSTNTQYSVMIGYSPGTYASDADDSIFIGNTAGFQATNADYSVFIGTQAGRTVTNSNALIIHSSPDATVGTNGLIYGEFNNRLLRVNGRLEATNGFLLRSNLVSTIPTLSPGDNFYWSSNGVPHVIWQDQAGTQATNRLVP